MSPRFKRKPCLEIRKAIITAAGKTQRTLPLQSLVDRDGKQKTALGVIVEEILKAGSGHIAVVVPPGAAAAYTAAAAPHSAAIHCVEQPAPLGYGHAVLCARDFTA